MKPRRDITLGEMQDECKTRIKCCTGCPYKEVCGEIPKLLDLTDPPRFNEQQMALLKGFYAIGAVSVQEINGFFAAVDKDGKVIRIARELGVSGETLDLAELLGKESNEKQ